jgi:myo-inositol-1(or 4)-monophosphatase
MRDLIKEALLSSGQILMGHFGKMGEVRQKSDQSNVVTKADLESEKNIVAMIEKRFPSHNIIAEETGFRNKLSEFTWVIDPLDGSSNFATGLPWFGILIAVLKDHKPIAAGVYLPFYNNLYLAEKGKGASRDGGPISVSAERNLKKVLFSYSLDYSEDSSKTEAESRIINELVRNVRNLRAINSVGEYCYVADGRLGGCINQTTKIWDIAAPALIIQEAGGIVTDISGVELSFFADRSDYDRNFTMVASGRNLHKRVMEIIKSPAPSPQNPLSPQNRQSL